MNCDDHSPRSAMNPIMPIDAQCNRPGRTLGIVITLCLSVCGCYNAHESIAMGEWKEVGAAESPVTSANVDATITPLAAGNGAIVKAGDLVQVRVTWNRKTNIVEGNQVTEKREVRPDTTTAWLWTGREPEVVDPLIAFLEGASGRTSSWGYLGSPSLRAGLIGQALNSSFRFLHKPGSETTVPLSGLILAGGFFTVQSDDTLDLKIIKICRGHLYRREAVLSQMGWVPFPSTDIKVSRRGTLRWSALEGECGPGDGKVRFQTNALYQPAKGETVLLDWHASFERLRPYSRFPEDYRMEKNSCLSVPKGKVRLCSESLDYLKFAGYANISPNAALDWKGLRFSFGGNGTAQTIRFVSEFGSSI